MRVYNVHSRLLAADPVAVGELLDSLAGRHDRLWPHDRWPAMRFDRPGLTVGGVGGHGPVGYAVEHHDPGRSVRFRFTGRPGGLSGTHQYVVQPAAGGAVLWHLMDGRVSAPTWLAWALFWRPCHDALVEDSLDRAQAALEPARAPDPSRWSPYVRLLRRLAVLVGGRRVTEPETSAPEVVADAAG